MRWELDRESDRFSSIPDADTTKGYSVFYEGGKWTAVRHERIGEGFPDHQEALDFCCRDAGVFDGSGIQGCFYGPNHEEVDGVFLRDMISGSFGASR